GGGPAGAEGGGEPASRGACAERSRESASRAGNASADRSRAHARHLGREGHGAPHEQPERPRSRRAGADDQARTGRDALGRARAAGGSQRAHSRVSRAALMPAAAPRFSADKLTFLKVLKRNN